MKHLFLDFETFGKDAGSCAAIDCSFFVADTDKMLSDKPYTCRDITGVKCLKLSVKDQVANCGFQIEQDTVTFWEQQNETVRKRIAPKPDDMNVSEFCKGVFDYLIESGKIDYWWSRSNSFDPIILWRLMKAAGKEALINEYLKFWRLRDIRTFIDAKFNFSTKNGFCPIADEEFWNKVFMEHDSRWDVLADVLRFQTILRVENDLEQVNR